MKLMWYDMIYIAHVCIDEELSDEWCYNMKNHVIVVLGIVDRAIEKLLMYSQYWPYTGIFRWRRRATRHAAVIEIWSDTRLLR